ncbi:Uncharacterised protein [Mycobacteroides abscessus subsp. abscessus]|nr:Uncharacterised protein [Mycobacteroides abscessus subsp. abscessus]
MHSNYWMILHASKCMIISNSVTFLRCLVLANYLRI